MSGPRNDEGATVGAAPPLECSGNESPDCASASQALQPPPSKDFATLQARLALAGWTLTGAGQDRGAASFLASRWNRARELPDLAAVARFANQVGAPS